MGILNFSNVVVVLGINMLSITASAQQSVSLETLKPLANVSSGEVLRDKALVYFWASWCSDCRDKLANVLPVLKKDFPDVSFVTVNMDRDESKGRAFVENEKVNFPVYRDETKAITKHLKLYGLPAWALIRKTKDGWMVQKSTVGAIADEMRAELGKSL